MKDWICGPIIYWFSFWDSKRRGGGRLCWVGRTSLDMAEDWHAASQKSNSQIEHYLISMSVSLTPGCLMYSVGWPYLLYVSVAFTRLQASCLTTLTISQGGRIPARISQRRLRSAALVRRLPITTIWDPQNTDTLLLLPLAGLPEPWIIERSPKKSSQSWEQSMDRMLRRPIVL